MTFVRKPAIKENKVVFVKYSQSKPGDVLAIGRYDRVDMVPAYDPTKGLVALHTIINEDGQEIKLNHTTKLSNALAAVGIGNYVEVIFLGKEPFKDKVTGRTLSANQFEVTPLELEEDAA